MVAKSIALTTDGNVLMSLQTKTKKSNTKKTKGRNESFSLYVSFSYFQLVYWEIFKFLFVCFSSSSMVPVRDVFSITVKNVLKAAFQILTQMGRNSVVLQLSRQSYSSQIAVCLENAVGQIKQEDVSYSSYKPLFFYSQHVFFSDYKNNTCLC